VTASNRPPVLNPIGAKTVSENQALTFTATATDPDGNALTFSGGNLPTGATLSAAGVFSWTPTFVQAGSYPVTVTVTDNGSPARATLRSSPSRSATSTGRPYSARSAPRR